MTTTHHAQSPAAPYSRSGRPVCYRRRPANSLGTSLAMTLAASLLLSGCFSGSSSSSNSNNNSSTGSDLFSPSPQNVTGGPVVDANNYPLDNAAVATLSEEEVRELIENLDLEDPQEEDVLGFNYNTNSDGILGIPLAPGGWFLAFNKDEGITVQRLQVLSENASPQALMMAGLSCQDELCQDISDRARLGAISGIVYNDDGPVSGAQVGLSGRAFTNGAFAHTFSDSDGYYQLSFNVGTAHVAGMQNASLRVSAPGHSPESQSLSLQRGNLAGVNARLESATEREVLWQESFESDSPTRAEWQVGGGSDDLRWQRLERGHGITNTRFNDTVLPAPGDTSEGLLPDPENSLSAFWFGDASRGNPGVEPGTTEPEAGTLTSPVIDLSGVDQDTPISLQFRTWWEISSVNPDDSVSAQDRQPMSVLVSTDGENFTTLARLTPRLFAQSGDDIDRETLPLTSRGFNQAPVWTQHEPIPLDELAGESSVTFRFQYAPREGGPEDFRGWLIDDVTVVEELGSFPL